MIQNANQQRGSEAPRCDDGRVHQSRRPFGGKDMGHEPATGQPGQQRMPIGVKNVLRKGPTHASKFTAECAAVGPLPSEGVDVFDRVPARCEEDGIGPKKNVGMQQSHPEPRQSSCLPAWGDALDGFVPGLHARKLAVFVKGHL